jgi:predicted RNA polymerase sigma factor
MRAETAARTAYGRLLALLAAVDHDVPAAEDALADAFERALIRWPLDGVPRDPDAWLLTVARNRRRDQWKSAAARTSVPLDAADPVCTPDMDDRDPRLELLLVCADPAINGAVRVPLMLNTVLGFTAGQIGRAFLVPPTTMAARLVRAKQRIKRDRIPFRIPDADLLPARLNPVLEAVYGAYSIEWPTVPRERHALILGLAETIAAAAAGSAEASGLAALLCLSSARLPARLDDRGAFVPLVEQDPRRWDRHLIALGHRHLRAAHALGTVGRFQLEAAIAAVHCARRPGAAPDWPMLRRLHESLQSLAPTAGGAVALAAVVAETDGPAAGLAALDRVPGLQRSQPAWATRAHLLSRLGDRSGADTALDKAISLTTDPAERAHLTALRLRLTEIRLGAGGLE